MSQASDEALRRRIAGLARTGTVVIDDFDRGVQETLGAKIGGFTPSNRTSDRRGYFWSLPTVKPPPGMPGIPVIFVVGEDNYERFKIPFVKVALTGLNPAMGRYHPGSVAYRVPAAGAAPVVVSGARGFDRYEEGTQADPYDLTYTITVIAKRRGQPDARSKVPVVEGGSSNALLTAVLRVYAPYCGVNVLDSLSDVRTYTAFQEGVSPVDEVTEVGDRQVGFSISLRIEGELDMNDPRNVTAARRLTLRSAPL